MYWSCGRHLVFYKPRYCTNSVGFPRWQLTAEGSHKSSTATGKRTRFWLEARYQKPLEIQVCQRRCEDHQFYSPSPSCLIYLSDILLTATLSVESLTPVAGGTTIACRLTVSSAALPQLLVDPVPIVLTESCCNLHSFTDDCFSSSRVWSIHVLYVYHDDCFLFQVF